MLLSIGVLILAFFLYHFMTRPPRRPAPPTEERIVVSPVKEVLPPAPGVVIEIEEEPVSEPRLPTDEEVPIVLAEEPPAYPFGIVPIVKSDDGSPSFDLVIVHTNDVLGNLYTENGGLGLARLSTLLKMGRGVSDNLLLLNTGTFGPLSSEHAEVLPLVIDEMGYDAYLPFEIDGTRTARSLAINALDEEGRFVVQPYQLYVYNDFVVGVVGVVGPKEIPSVTFDSDVVLSNAQHAVDLAHTFVDYLIVLTDLGEGPFSSTDLAESVDGIDLIIDGNGDETVLDVNDTLIVRGGGMLQSVGGLVLTVVDGEVMLTQLLSFAAEDLLNPAGSEVLQAYGELAERHGTPLPGEIDEDPAIVALIGTLTEEPAGPPPPPFVFDPMVFSQEEYDLFQPAATEPSPEDDDFWADFFVVGEDSLMAYDDGIYYFRLFVNEDLLGTIEIHFKGKERLISVEDLRYYVLEHLTNEARIRIFTGLVDFVTPDELERRGVETVYDEQAFTLHLTFSIEDMPERILSLSSATINRREQYAISGAIPLKPQWFSLAANLNLFGQVEYPDD
ncbi:MAG: hypothetical protein GX911_00930, partial [Spirochaetales bacterium]|nr:hypothetical protein [Spirochaetales bacterium]